MIANNIEIERVNYIPAKEPYRSRSASSLYSEIAKFNYEETEKREAAKKPFEDYREVVDKLRNLSITIDKVSKEIKPQASVRTDIPSQFRFPSQAAGFLI